MIQLATPCGCACVSDTINRTDRYNREVIVSDSLYMLWVFDGFLPGRVKDRLVGKSSVFSLLENVCLEIYRYYITLHLNLLWNDNLI